MAAAGRDPGDRLTTGPGVHCPTDTATGTRARRTGDPSRTEQASTSPGPHVQPRRSLVARDGLPRGSAADRDKPRAGPQSPGRVPDCGRVLAASLCHIGLAAGSPSPYYYNAISSGRPRRPRRSGVRHHRARTPRVRVDRMWSKRVIPFPFRSSAAIECVAQRPGYPSVRTGTSWERRHRRESTGEYLACSLPWGRLSLGSNPPAAQSTSLASCKQRRKESYDGRLSLGLIDPGPEGTARKVQTKLTTS
jgi:hypothetical protein